jgi:hypothetical protein
VRLCKIPRLTVKSAAANGRNHDANGRKKHPLDITQYLRLFAVPILRRFAAGF